MIMKFKELKGMSTDERAKQLSDMRMELMKLNAQVKSGSAPKNPGQIRALKRNIARLLTLGEAKTTNGGH